MDLMDILNSAGASSSLGQIAGAAGIDGSQTKKLVGALAPALMQGLQKQADSDGGLEALQSELAGGNHQRGK